MCVDYFCFSAGKKIIELIAAEYKKQQDIRYQFSFKLATDGVHLIALKKAISGDIL